MQVTFYCNNVMRFASLHNVSSFAKFVKFGVALCVSLLLVAFGVLPKCFAGDSFFSTNDKHSLQGVVVSNNAIALAVNIVAAEFVDITIAEPVGDEHDSTLLPKDAQKMQSSLVIYFNNSDAIFYKMCNKFSLNCLEIAKSDKFKHLVAEFEESEGIILNADEPHFWLSPELFAFALMSVSSVLQQNIPRHAETIKKNTADALFEMYPLFAECKAAMQTCDALPTFTVENPYENLNAIYRTKKYETLMDDPDEGVEKDAMLAINKLNAKKQQFCVLVPMFDGGEQNVYNDVNTAPAGLKPLLSKPDSAIKIGYVDFSGEGINIMGGVDGYSLYILDVLKNIKKCSCKKPEEVELKK